MVIKEVVVILLFVVETAYLNTKLYPEYNTKSSVLHVKLLRSSEEAEWSE